MAEKDSDSAARALLAEAAELELQRREARLLHSPSSLLVARGDHAANRRSLKTDFKKCSGFVSRVRTLQENQRDALLRDAATLNLGRYIDELVAALADTPLKAADVPTAAAVCGELHRRYEDFASRLLPEITKTVLPAPRAALPRRSVQQVPVDQETLREEAKKRRAHLRLLLELYLAGIATDVELMERIMATLCGEGPMPARQPRGPEPERPAPNLPLLVQCVKVAGPHLFGVVPRKLRDSILDAGENAPEALLELLKATEESDIYIDSDEAETTASELENQPPVLVFGKRHMETMRSRIVRTYEAAASSLQQQHKRLGVLKERCLKEEAMNGELREDKANALNELTLRYEKMHMVVDALSDGLQLDMPELKEEEEAIEKQGSMGISLWEKERSADDDDTRGPYDNEEERAFYCDLPDVLSMIPRDSLGLNEEEVEQLKERNRLRREERLRQQGFLEETEEDGQANSNEKVSLDDDEGPGTETLEDEGGIDELLSSEGNDVEDSKSGPFAALMRLLTVDLLALQSAQDCDAFVMAFCVANRSGKGAQKRLVLEVLRCPKERLELLPFFARVLATLAQCFDDIVPPIVDALRKEAYRCTRAARDNDRSALNRHFAGAFVGELVKVNVAPPNIALRAIRFGLREFKSGALQLVAILWERCGRFLVRCKHTFSTATSLLDEMMKLLKAKFVDASTATLLENAYFSVRPPSVQREAKAPIPPMHQFVKHLLLGRLSETPPESAQPVRGKKGRGRRGRRDEAKAEEVRQVVTLLRKLPWSDPDEGAALVKFTAKCIRKSSNSGRAESLKSVVDVLAGLHRYHPEIVVRVCDRVFEDIYQFLELRGAIPLVAYQRRAQISAREGLTGVAEAIGVAGEESVLLLARRDVQQRVGYMRLISELFSSQIISSRHLYRVLHMILARGHEVPESMRERPFLSVDPRMPSLADGPEDVSRIQMALTLLERCGPTLASQPGQHKRLGKFLAYLQRYVYAKTLRPAHIEWATMDLLDMLEVAGRAAAGGHDGDAEDGNGKKKNRRNQRSQRRRRRHDQGNDGRESEGPLFTRYNNFSEAHAAVSQWEEEDMANGRPPLHGITSDLCGLGFDEEDVEDTEREVNDEDHDEDEEDEEDDGKAAEEQEHEEDEDDEDEEEEVDEEEVDESVVVRRSKVISRTEDDDIFEKELNAQISSYTQIRLSGTGYSGASDNMVLPTVLPKAVNTTTSNDGTDGKLAFRMLRRVPGKGKVEARMLRIPEATGVAQRQRLHEDKERREREMVKDRVLRLEREREIEEMNAIFQSRR